MDALVSFKGEEGGGGIFLAESNGRKAEGIVTIE